MSNTNMSMALLHKYDQDCTNLKCVDMNHNIHHPPRRKTTQNHAHYSHQPNDYQSEIHKHLLPRPRRESLPSDEIVECDRFRAMDPPSTTQVYNNRTVNITQSRALPETPHEASLDDSPVSSSVTSCSSCGRPGHDVKYEKHFCRRYYLACLAIGSILFSLISCSIATLGFVVKTTPLWDKMMIKESAYETCVPCDQLLGSHGINAGLESQLTQKMADGKLVCCAHTSGQMSTLVQLIMQQKTGNVVTGPAPIGLKFTPASAHKFFQPWSSSETEEPQFPDMHYPLKLRPSNDDTNGEHARNVTAKNSSLQILFSGWYLVYSSVYFRPRTNKTCRHLRYQTWGHFIIRTSSSRRSASGTLLQTAHTCCDNCTDDHHTSYTAGVFLLEAGDDVSAEVSGSGLVMFDEEASYLGLVMLGSWSSSKTQ